MTEQAPTQGTALRLHFVRHGATPPNLAGLRCGGDLDVDLTDLGRQQAREAAVLLARVQPRITRVVCSALLRTQETAAIIAAALGGLPVAILPAFAERRLGAWNLRSIAQTEGELAAGVTPPGGESREAFRARISGAVDQLRPWLHHGVLLVGSKGVARVLGELTGRESSARVDNGRVLHFDLAPVRRTEPAGSAA